MDRVTYASALRWVGITEKDSMEVMKNHCHEGLTYFTKVSDSGRLAIYLNGVRILIEVDRRG